MSARSLLRKPNRDPYWEIDGPTARREHRMQRIRGSLAFGTSLLALAGAAFAWSIYLGIAAAIGIHAQLPFG